jgi:TPR repeat protein
MNKVNILVLTALATLSAWAVMASEKEKCSTEPYLYAKVVESLSKKTEQAAKVVRLDIAKDCNTFEAMKALDKLKKEILAKTFPQVDQAVIKKESEASGHSYPYGLVLMNMKQYDQIIPALILESSYLSMTAQVVLWNMYEWGLKNGPAKFDPRIFKFYQEMANEGHPRFQYNLGKIYAAGIGQAKNLNLAEKWLALSTLLEAKIDLGILYLQEKNMPKEAEKVWLSVVDENSEAAYYLGLLYRDQKKYDLAFKNFVRRHQDAPEEPETLVTLGQMYLEGWGTKENCEKGKELYELAANKLNFEFAQEALKEYAKSQHKKLRCFKATKK